MGHRPFSPTIQGSSSGSRSAINPLYIIFNLHVAVSRLGLRCAKTGILRRRGVLNRHNPTLQLHRKPGFQRHVPRNPTALFTWTFQHPIHALYPLEHIATLLLASSSPNTPICVVTVALTFQTSLSSPPHLLPTFLAPRQDILRRDDVGELEQGATCSS